jgi:hypothetical protein
MSAASGQDDGYVAHGNVLDAEMVAHGLDPGLIRGRVAAGDFRHRPTTAEATMVTPSRRPPGSSKRKRNFPNHPHIGRFDLARVIEPTGGWADAVDETFASNKVTSANQFFTNKQPTTRYQYSLMIESFIKFVKKHETEGKTKVYYHSDSKYPPRYASLDNYQTFMGNGTAAETSLDDSLTRREKKGKTAAERCQERAGVGSSRLDSYNAAVIML